MNTSVLKAFAPAVRRHLMEAVTRKLDFVLSAQTPDYLTTYVRQVSSLRDLADADRAGLIERVAYTWFNRLTALRYLDARGWHPFRCRVLMAASPEETQPEILKLMRTGALPSELRQHTNPARLNDLLDERIPSFDPQGEVYRHLVLAACHFYHALLPDVFERLDDETELLLPDDVLSEQSVAYRFRTEITDADCSEVEILGWLYQFYIAEKKDEVMARKKAVPSEDIPAVTQLFTPHWIVRYLVENSLGRLWLLNRPSSRLRERMPYYIDGEAEGKFLHISKPEEVRLFDPAVGSGHMLTYAFDLLYYIYEEEGYAPAEIPALILAHNLHGVDICPRAAQIAALALMLKARERSRRFFQSETSVHPRILVLHDICFDQGELNQYVQTFNLGALFDHSMLNLLRQFEETSTVGSLILPCIDEPGILVARNAIESIDPGDHLLLSATQKKVLRVLEQAHYLSQRYQVVIANPPYMGSAQMNPRLKMLIINHWQAGKADTYAAFILRNLALTRPGGFSAMITIPNWMFLKTFGALRDTLLRTAHILSLVHCGRGVWGPDFGSCGFVLQSASTADRAGHFKRLFKRQGEVQSNEELEANFFNTADFPNYSARHSDFKKVPGHLIAYWLSPAAFFAFSATHLKNLADIRSGIGTSDNERFLRLWYEVPHSSIGFDCQSILESIATRRKWFTYNKGGGHRRWFGNREYVVNWFNDGAEIKEAVTSNPKDPDTTHWSRRIFNTDLFFQPSLTWNDVGVSLFSVRLNESGFIHDAVGVGAYDIQPDRVRLATLSLLNTRVARLFVEVLCPTVHFKAGQMESFPVIIPDDYREDSGVECVSLAREDWNSFETSWDFRNLPLLRPELKSTTLKASWQNWTSHCDIAIGRMQELETENNRLFIAAYGLQEELQPEVPADQITLARADARKDMVAFLSYAVGCMMGRYSLDRPGLILADAGSTLDDYRAKLDKDSDELIFRASEDGIIPVLEGEWFDNDIVVRTREFVRACFGEATLRENVRFIEASLGKELRKYFLVDFYKDHVQTYRKRPIYWMVQSPRKGFSVLIYLHRYTRDTMNIVLNRYLRDYQMKLRNRLTHLTDTQASEAISTRDKTAARKEADRLTKILHECEEWERETVLPLAQARIELDLDDGVKANYLKLREALAPIPGLAAEEE